MRPSVPRAIGRLRWARTPATVTPPEPIRLSYGWVTWLRAQTWRWTSSCPSERVQILWFRMQESGPDEDHPNQGMMRWWEEDYSWIPTPRSYNFQRVLPLEAFCWVSLLFILCVS